MDPSSPNFIHFSCPLIPWVRDLPWTNPWSDGLTCLMRNVPILTGCPRVINVVRTHEIHSVVNLLERSIPSSSVPFPLFKPTFLPFILYFLYKIYNQANRVSARGHTMMKCSHQVRMTLALQVKRGIRQPPFLLQGMRVWTQIGQRVILLIA